MWAAPRLFGIRDWAGRQLSCANQVASARSSFHALGSLLQRSTTAALLDVSTVDTWAREPCYSCCLSPRPRPSCICPTLVLLILHRRDALARHRCFQPGQTLYHSWPRFNYSPATFDPPQLTLQNVIVLCFVSSTDICICMSMLLFIVCKFSTIFNFSWRNIWYILWSCIKLNKHNFKAEIKCNKTVLYT